MFVRQYVLVVVVMAVLGARQAHARLRAVQCPDETKSGCVASPSWTVQYDMAGSGYVYCYNSCPLAWLSNQTAGAPSGAGPGLVTQTFGGLVGVDHYWTHQGMPCVNGRPREFEMQDEFTQATKKDFPRVKVLEYRITCAVPYAGIVHDLMESTPEYFVRWHHEPNANGSICTVPAEHKTGRPGDNCSWPIRAASYDWTQQAVRNWFLENVIKPVMKYADGVWLDGDGPDNGSYQCAGSYDRENLKAPYPALNESETAAFCAGETQVTQAAQEWLIANKGFDYNCIDFIGPPAVPEAGDSAATCVGKMQSLARRFATPQRAVVLYGSRTASQGYTEATVAQATAVFLLLRGEYFWFGYPAANTFSPAATGLLLADYGVPLGNMTQTGNVFSRKYSKAVVSLDCEHFAASFSPV